MDLKFAYAKAFGNERFFPLDKIGKIVVNDLMRRRTLTRDQILLLKAAGFEIKILRDEVII